MCIEKTALIDLIKPKLNWQIFILSIFCLPLNAQNVGIGTTKPPSEKLTVAGTVRVERNSDVNSPSMQLHETEYDYSRLRFSNNGTSKYFSLKGRPAMDSSESKFTLYNSDIGDIFTATAAGRFGINTEIPAATFHVDGISGFDPIRIQNDNATKFRIFSNNAIVLGANWQNPIADVIRMETPHLFIGFDGDHLPVYKLEVDGHVKMNKLVITQGGQQGKVLTSSAGGIGTWQNLPSDSDPDPTNEIQTISKSLGTVTLSGGGGSFVDAVKDADADSSNEIQTISKSFGTVTLSDGGGTFFDEVNDNDSDPANEIQDLSLSGNTLSISDANTVKLSSIADPLSREVIVTNRAATSPQIALDIDATESFVFNRMSGGASLAFLNSSNNIDVKTSKVPNSITGQENISIGSNPDASNITGDGNIILGQHTDTEYSGNDNIMIGKEAGSDAANNYFGNIFIGEKAGWFTDANSNICIGNGSGSNAAGLSVYIGDHVNSAVAGHARCVGIGYQTYTSGSDQVRFGNATTLSIGGYKPWTNLSDGRFKENVKENVPGLSFINELRPVSYVINIKNAEKFTRGEKAYDRLEKEYKIQLDKRNQKLESGFIAQEVEKAAQSLGYEFNGVIAPQNDRDPYSLAYSQFVVPLVKAVQELDEKNKALEKQNQDLEDRLARLERLVVGKN